MPLKVTVQRMDVPIPALRGKLDAWVKEMVEPDASTHGPVLFSYHWDKNVLLITGEHYPVTARIQLLERELVAAVYVPVQFWTLARGHVRHVEAWVDDVFQRINSSGSGNFKTGVVTTAPQRLGIR